MLPQRAEMSAGRPVDTRKEADKLKLLPGQSLGRALRSRWLPKVKGFLEDCQRSYGRPTSAALARGLHFVRDQYLPALEFDVARKMTPEMARYGRIKETLERLSDDRNRVPRRVARKAAQLLEIFEDMGWNATPRHNTGTPIRPAPQRSSDYLPPEDHPIFGIGAIAEGITMHRGPRGKTTYRLNDRLRRRKRDAKCFGHNGQQPGFWVPRRASLIYWGLHDQPERGIDGDPRLGAYSIVISGTYEDTDRDEGHVVYYSAEGARGKDAGRKEGVKGNLALARSLRTRNPVRVHRSAKKGSGPYAPPCGIRYDGLYQVVGMERRMNKEGGHYNRFKLERMADQPSLEDIVRTSPTQQQQADYARIREGY